MESVLVKPFQNKYKCHKIHQQSTRQAQMTAHGHECLLMETGKSAFSHFSWLLCYFPARPWDQVPYRGCHLHPSLPRGCPQGHRQTPMLQMLCKRWAALRLVGLRKSDGDSVSETYFMQGRQIVPSFSVVSGFICNQQTQPRCWESASSAVRCSPLVCTALNHLILKFRSGRGSLWWEMIICEKGKSRARSPILKKPGC